MARRPRSCCIRRGPSDSLTQCRMRSSAVSVFSPGPRKGASVTSDGKAIKWQPLQLEDLLRHGNRSRAGNVCKVHSLAQSRLLQGADAEPQGHVAEQGKVISRTPLTPLQCLVSISTCWKPLAAQGTSYEERCLEHNRRDLRKSLCHCRVTVSVLAVASHRSLTDKVESPAVSASAQQASRAL